MLRLFRAWARWRSWTQSPWSRSRFPISAWTEPHWARAGVACRLRFPIVRASRCWGHRARRARGNARVARNRSYWRPGPERAKLEKWRRVWNRTNKELSGVKISSKTISSGVCNLVLYIYLATEWNELQHQQMRPLRPKLLLSALGGRHTAELDEPFCLFGTLIKQICTILFFRLFTLLLPSLFRPWFHLDPAMRSFSCSTWTSVTAAWCRCFRSQHYCKKGKLESSIFLDFSQKNKIRRRPIFVHFMSSSYYNFDLHFPSFRRCKSFESWKKDIPHRFVNHLLLGHRTWLAAGFKRPKICRGEKKNTWKKNREQCAGRN